MGKGAQNMKRKAYQFIAFKNLKCKSFLTWCLPAQS